MAFSKRWNPEYSALVQAYHRALVVGGVTVGAIVGVDKVACFLSAAHLVNDYIIGEETAEPPRVPFADLNINTDAVKKAAASLIAALGP